MSLAIMLVPVIVASVTYLLTRRYILKQQRVMRKMLEAQIRFLQAQVKQLQTQASVATEHPQTSSAPQSPTTGGQSPEVSQDTGTMGLPLTGNIDQALKELTHLRRSEAELQRRIDSHILSFQEKDALVERLQARIRDLETAYFAEKDHAETLERQRAKAGLTKTA